MGNTKILVAAPTFSGMSYCQDVFLNRVKNLHFPSYNILIVDNSRDLNYFNELSQTDGVIVIHDPTSAQKSVFRLISSRNLIIDYALKNDYSHILMLDSDVVPPKNIIQELLSCNRDIVSGLYFNFFMVGNEKKWLPVSWKLLTDEEFFELKKIPQYSNFKREDLRRHITQEEIDSGSVQEVIMPSAGCMLISKEVFSKVRYGKFSETGGADDDRFFIDFAIKKGFTPFCFPKVLCEHLVKEKYYNDNKGNLIHSSFSDMT